MRKRAIQMSKEKDPQELLRHPKKLNTKAEKNNISTSQSRDMIEMTDEENNISTHNQRHNIT